MEIITLKMNISQTYFGKAWSNTYSSVFSELSVKKCL